MEITEPRPVGTGETLRALVEELAADCAGQRGSLLPLLHALQAEVGFVPDEAVPYLAAALNISRAEVHGVVTFYPDFRRKPAGRHVVKICRAESCQSRGGSRIEALAADRFGTPVGSTRRDGQVTLEAVYCLGLCATGPNVLVDGRPISRVDAAKLDRIAAEISA